MRAVALLEQGMTQAAVARELGVTASAVSQWHTARKRDGVEALAAKPHPGPTPKLTPTQMRRLEKMLVQGPTRHGYATELWTCKRVAELIEKRFGVRYDTSGVWHLLNRIGWSCQKPERRARERDEDAVVTWRKKDWPRIKKRAT